MPRTVLATGICGCPALNLNMDGQHSDRSRSRTSIDRTSSAMSRNPRSVQPWKTWESQRPPSPQAPGFFPFQGSKTHPRGYILGQPCWPVSSGIISKSRLRELGVGSMLLLPSV